MEVRYLYWSFVFAGLAPNSLTAIVATESCEDDLSKTNNAISDLTISMSKMESGIGTLQTQVSSEEDISRQAAELHAEELKIMSGLKIDLEQWEDKQNIQLVKYDVMTAPTADFKLLSSYSRTKRSEVEAVRTNLVDNLWRGQLTRRSVDEVTDLFGQLQAWMNDLLATVETQQASCTSDLDKASAMLNRTIIEIRLLQSEASLDVTRAKSAESAINDMTDFLKARLGRCIPDSLHYNVLSNSSSVTVDPIVFVTERCATYTAGAMSDCVNEQNENRLKYLELTLTLENQTRTDEAMNCYMSKAEIDFAKCKVGLSNCERLLERENDIIENPYPLLHEKTTHALQLYQDISEIRSDRTMPLEKKVKEIGDKLSMELDMVTVDHLADRSYELHYLAMEEYVNQATKWLCSHVRLYCDAGELCGLKPFPNMLSNIEEFENNLSNLTEKFYEETMAEDIVPYGTIQPANAYNYLLKVQLMDSEEYFDKIWNNMTEDLFRMTTEDIYKEKSEDGVLTKDIAWLVSNEVYSWLSLTPQMRIFISKVTEMFSLVIRESSAVRSLVECVCISSECDGKNIMNS